MSNVRIITGDCIESMRRLPAGSIHTCVTSPPYFGLRDYGHEGQIGLEETPDAFVAKLVEVFREVHRVLRDDGTLWLNLGDSYAGSWGAEGRRETEATEESWQRSRIVNHPKRARKCPDGLKPKDRMMIPARVALALQADGWWLRDEIVWHKPNPMPSSVQDRTTPAHEMIYLLSKGPRYFYDQDAIKEPIAESSASRLAQPALAQQAGSARANGGAKTNGNMKAVGGADGKRNRRSVWTVATQPFREAHFATFPPSLIEPCILAGAPAGGTVLDPFGGAGTTGIVAATHGRDAILCELSPDYASMARARIDAHEEAMRRAAEEAARQPGLFDGMAAE